MAAEARTRPVVRLAAEIDTTNAHAIATELAAACVPGVEAVIADLSQTTFCDSSGVRALLQTHKQAESRGIELKLAVSSDAVIRVMELLGLLSTLRLYPTVEAAVQS